MALTPFFHLNFKRKMHILIDETNQSHQYVKSRLDLLAEAHSSFEPVTLHLIADTFMSAIRSQTRDVLPLFLGECHGDCVCELGKATGLNAVARQDSRTRFSLAEGSVLNNGTIKLTSLMEGAIPTLRNWEQNKFRFLDVVIDYIEWWLLRSQELGHYLQVGQARHLNLKPADRVSLRKVLLSKSRWILNGLSRRSKGKCDYSWRISCGRLENDRIVDIQHLANDGPNWLADPFLVEEHPHLWMFCEKWCETDRKGVIDLIEVLPDGFQRHGTVLSEPYHLSFPYVFRHKQKWYATVESSDASEIRLYEAVVFPHECRLNRILLQGQWADPVLIESDGVWYLMASAVSSRSLPRETAPELHLFHSSDLLLGSFVPHRQSPLLIDSSGGRNGGLFHTDEGDLIRVAQQIGFGGGYGTDVELRRIAALNIDRYEEQLFPFRAMDQLRRDLGASHLHTMSRSGKIVAVDWVRGS